MAHTETFYVWKQLVLEEGATKPRLVTPWGDPFEYEFAFDFQFDSPEHAQAVKDNDEFGPSSEETDWILCKVTLEVVE